VERGGQDIEAAKGREKQDIEAAVNEDIASFVKNGRLSSQYASLILPKKIAAFLTSDCLHRMAAAQEKNRLFKERPFVMTVPASRLDAAFPEEEKVLVQGVIDVYFEEEDGIVILDYKTDSVQDMHELTDRYRTQLDCYAEAVETITGKRVKEKIIYSFALSDIIVW
jgi:ATP-dependent helicase/nuclease subunit A